MNQFNHPINLVILDFDGTLADTQRLIVSTLKKALLANGWEAADTQACKATIGLPLVKAFEQLYPMTKSQAEACAETYRDIFDQDNVPGMVTLFPTVDTTIHSLNQQGVRLSIASSRGKDSLMMFVKDFHFDEIECIVSANDVKNAKPHPEAVLQTLKKMGVSADETLVVGDAVFDIEMGKAAGVRTCAVTYGNGTLEEMKAAKPDFMIHRFDELLTIVEQSHSDKSRA